jgi:hypothetical protein
MKPVGRARKIIEWFFPVPTPEQLGTGPVGTGHWPFIILIIVGLCAYLVYLDFLT